MRRFKAKSDELKANLANGTNEEPSPAPRARVKKAKSSEAGGGTSIPSILLHFTS